MALSITTITPNEGATAGKTRIKIEGTDFDFLPYPPTQQGYIGTPPPTLKVFFGLLEATGIWVYPKVGGGPGETVIECSTPRFTGDPNSLPALVDVKVQNLVVPGIITVTNGFKYKHQDVTVDNVLARVTKSLLMELARQIPTKSRAYRVHTDYDDFPADGMFDTVKIADIPALVLMGPHIERTGGAYRTPDQVCSTTETLYRAGTYVDLRYVIELYDEHSDRLLNLVNLLINFVDENGRLSVENMIGNPSQGFTLYDMDWGDLPDVNNAANKNNIVSASGSLVVKGVHSSRVSPVQWGQAIETDSEVSLEIGSKSS